MRLNDLGEFGLIDRLAALLPPLPSGVLTGVGDDCAVLDAPGDRALLFAADACIEGTHFFIETPQIGWKALVANLSDIAAMGGRPLAALAVLAARPDVDVRVADLIYEDLARASAHYSVPVVGGDTVSTSGPLTLAISVLGDVPKGQVLRRCGAQPGHVLMATGWLGCALGGLEVYRARREMWSLAGTIASQKPPMEYQHRLAFVTATLLRTHRQRPQLGDAVASHRLELEFHEPLAHVAAGRALAESGVVSAMMDVSDGLAGDASKLASASGVGICVDARRIPLCPDLVACYGTPGAISLALQGGEDYALIFTVPPEHVAHAEEALARIDYSAAAIGTVVPEDEGCTFLDRSGQGHPLATADSWDHFR